MPSPAVRFWRFLSRHWLGQLIWAALLPGWVLLIASTIHAPRSVSFVTIRLASGLAIGVGCAAVGLAVWGAVNRDRHPTSRVFWTTQPDQPPHQHMAGLIGGAAFFAALFQLAADFDVFSNLLQAQSWTRSMALSSWDTLLILSAVQFVFFFIEFKLRRS